MGTLLALLLLAAAPGAAQEEGVVAAVDFKHGPDLRTSLSGGQLALAAVLMPLAYAYALPHYGFGAFPYVPGGYGRGERAAGFEATTSYQAASGGRGAAHGLARVRGENRLGWDAAFSFYQRGLLRPERRAALVSAHITSNYLQEAESFVELGVGGATYQDPSALWGPSLEASWELFPRRPYSFGLRVQSAVMRGQGYHTLSAVAGVGWRWLGLQAGWRVFLDPRKNVTGPELALSSWF